MQSRFQKKVRGDKRLEMRLAERLRLAVPIKLGDTSWRLGVNDDNFYQLDVLTVSLYPSHKAREADPALELLRTDYGGLYEQAPRGAALHVDINVQNIEGKRTLCVFERQAALGYSRMLKISSQRQNNKYHKMLRKVMMRILDVARENPDIEQVLAISGREVQKHFAEKKRMNKQNVEDNYGIRHFFPDMGFKLLKLPEGKQIYFSRGAAFKRDNFFGPFWRLKLKRQATRGNIPNLFEDIRSLEEVANSL